MRLTSASMNLTDAIEQARIAASRPPLANGKKNLRDTPEYKAFEKAFKARGDINVLSPEEKATDLQRLYAC